MNKEELLQGLEKALKIAERREAALRQYIAKERQLKQEMTEAKTVPWMTRIMAAKIPLIVFLAINIILPRNMIMLIIEAPIGLIAMAVAIYQMVQAGKKYYDSAEYTEKLAAVESKRNKINETLGASINASYEESLAVFPSLPKEYHTCFTLSKLITYFQCGRADTLKEAMEAYETDCHRMRMEESQKQVLQEMQNLQSELIRVEQVAYNAYYNK